MGMTARVWELKIIYIASLVQGNSVRVYYVRRKTRPEKPNCNPDSEWNKLYINPHVFDNFKRNGTGFKSKFHRMKKLFKILVYIHIDFYLNSFQRVSSPYDQMTSPIDTKF